jgi:K(+)-stimulated pyrophosphate-energized sodium pump
LNPLIKVMNLVSLLILPAVISLHDNNIRYVLAGAALIVLLIAIFFSKRSTGSLTDVPASMSTAAPATAVTAGD